VLLITEELIDDATELFTEELVTTEDLLLDELEIILELAALELLTGVVPFETEHSLVPPDTFVPVPKVTSPHTKLPLNVL
jgi:hypothetical protein